MVEPLNRDRVPRLGRLARRIAIRIRIATMPSTDSHSVTNPKTIQWSSHGMPDDGENASK